ARLTNIAIFFSSRRRHTRFDCDWSSAGCSSDVVMSDITVGTVGKPFTATLTPPGSKSLTNRALVLGALADGTCDVSNVLFADDTDVMLESLARLGFRLTIDRDKGAVGVDGRGGRIETEAAELHCANSGTTIRFLTALCALG